MPLITGLPEYLIMLGLASQPHLLSTTDSLFVNPFVMGSMNSKGLFTHKQQILVGPMMLHKI